jgi:tetratricopeptide (TPR) repeat protein
MGKEEKAIECNNIGVEEFANKNYNKALEHFKRSIEFDPEYAPAWRNVANCYIMLDNPQKGLSYAQKGLELEPDNQTGRTRLGTIYNNFGIEEFKKKNYKKAIEHFRRTTELNPVSASAWRNIAHSYIMLENYQAGLSYAEKAVELEPDNQTGKKRLATIQSKLKLNPATQQKKSPTSIENLKKLFQITDKLSIDDISGILKMSRTDTLMKMVEISNVFPGLRISGNDVIIKHEGTEGMAELMNVLDNQFSDWESKEIAKDGKIE